MVRSVTFKGAPLTLAGRAIVQDKPAPDFHVVGRDLKEVTLADFKGKIKVISVFPSLDTPVCDLQVKEFNKRAASFSPGVVVVGISKDLPFAQARFCQMHDITNEVILSDYKTGSFGINYGMLIKELNLLARGVVIIDKNDVLRYAQVVPEVTDAVNFDDAVKHLEAVVKSASVVVPGATQHRCVPCEGGAVALSTDKARKLLASLERTFLAGPAGRRGWQLVDDKKLVREFPFKDFAEAKYFMDIVAVIAEEQGHHPALTLSYGKLKVTLTTHAAGGLTGNDFIMAEIIDELG